jgi:hypothetical protein
MSTRVSMASYSTRSHQPHRLRGEKYRGRTRQQIRPHFASCQRFRVGRMPARSPSVKPPDAASPVASPAKA